MKIFQKTNAFEGWVLSLKDRVTRIRIQARIDRVEDGHFGDYKSVAKGCSRCDCILGQLIVFTRPNRAARLLFCWQVVTKAANQVTFKMRLPLQSN